MCRISVLLAVRNGMPYLPETIRSVLGQTLPAFEILVIDDDSTDDTPRWMRACEDPRVRYVRLEGAGFSGALNYGIEHARSPLVARIDADDVARPDRLAVQCGYMASHPECVLLGCQTDEIDEEGRVVGQRSFPLMDESIRWRMAFGCPFLHPGVLYRRESVQSVGGYVTETWPADDYALWTRMAAVGQLANCPETLMQYRIRQASVTNSQRDVQIELCSRIAASYAKRLVPEVEEHCFAELYHFVATGRDPQRSALFDLAAMFRRFKADFLGRMGRPSVDLMRWIAAVQRTLRWRCVERAQATWHQPARAWAWLRLARAFDPEDGTVPRMIARWLRGRFPGRGGSGAA